MVAGSGALHLLRVVPFLAAPASAPTPGEQRSARALPSATSFKDYFLSENLKYLTCKVVVSLSRYKENGISYKTGSRMCETK